MKVSYTRLGDYELPNLVLENKERYNIGKYGLLKLDYLKKYKKAEYINLLMNDELNKYLHEVDTTLMETELKLINKLAEKEKMNEYLKSNNQMLWIGKMNNIKNRAEEIILKEYIFV